MPGISQAEAKLSIRDRFGTYPLEVVHSLSQTEWFGPYTVQVADAVTEQSLTALGTGGLTTVTALLITSDVNISLTYGTAANNEPIPLNANGFHLMSGTSLTAIAVSNSSGSTANVTYFVAGS